MQNSSEKEENSEIIDHYKVHMFLDFDFLYLFLLFKIF